MTILKITLRTGRTAEQKQELARRLSEAAARILGEPVEEIRVVFYEVGAEDWYVGGKPLTTQPTSKSTV